MASQASFTRREAGHRTVFDVTPCDPASGFVLGMGVVGLIPAGCLINATAPGADSGWSFFMLLVAVGFALLIGVRMAAAMQGRRGQRFTVGADGIDLEGGRRIRSRSISGIYVLDGSGRPVSSPALAVAVFGGGATGAPVAAGLAAGAIMFTAAHAAGNAAGRAQAAREVRVVAHLDDGALATIASGLTPDIGDALAAQVDAALSAPRRRSASRALVAR